jgi:hypothetical protein
MQAVGRSAYLKLFRDVLWEAALAGCSGSGSGSGSSSATQHLSGQPKQQQQRNQQQQERVRYDAVLAVGSPSAGTLVLEALRAAERAGKARLPVVVQYMVRARACVCLRGRLGCVLRAVHRVDSRCRAGALAPQQLQPGTPACALTHSPTHARRPTACGTIAKQQEQLLASQSSQTT